MLKEKVIIVECRLLVEIGMFCVVYLLKDDMEIIYVVIVLLLEVKLSLEFKNEVLYYCVKVYLNQKVDKVVMGDLKELVKDICNLYGVEVKFLVVQELYNLQNYVVVEKELLNFID